MLAEKSVDIPVMQSYIPGTLNSVRWICAKGRDTSRQKKRRRKREKEEEKKTREDITDAYTGIYKELVICCSLTLGF